MGGHIQRSDVLLLAPHTGVTTPICRNFAEANVHTRPGEIRSLRSDPHIGPLDFKLERCRLSYTHVGAYALSDETESRLLLGARIHYVDRSLVSVRVPGTNYEGGGISRRFDLAAGDTMLESIKLLP